MLRSAAAILVQEIADLRSVISPLELLTPTNYGAMKRQWLESGRKFFNPQFIYDLDAIRINLHQAETILRSLDEVRTYFYAKQSDPLGKLVYNSFDLRCREFYYLAIFLQTLLAGTPGDHYEEPLAKLYGTIDTSDLTLAKAMIEKSPAQALRDKFTENPDLPEASRKKLDKFFKENLFDFRGMLLEAQKDTLKAKDFDAHDIAKHFQTVLNYMRKYATLGLHMSAEEAKSPSYQIEISPKYTAVSVRTFSASGKSVIGIPADRKVNGLKLVALVGHELNSHYRSAMSTRNLYRNIIEYCEEDLLIPLVPFISHSLNGTMSEALAKFSDIQVIGANSIPKPYQVLAIDFVKQGHNFGETMEYVFELARQNHKTEDSALNNAWKYAYRIFRGQTDTSSHCGYAFTKDQCYLIGFTQALREISQTDDRSIETFPDLLRYSALTLDEIKAIGDYENESKCILNDPYRDFPYLISNCLGEPLLSPVEYAANLLL